MAIAIQNPTILPSTQPLHNTSGDMAIDTTMSAKVATQLTARVAAAAAQPAQGQSVALREPAIDALPPEAILAALKASPEQWIQAENAAMQEVFEQLPPEQRSAPSTMAQIKDDPQFARYVLLMLMYLQMTKTDRDDNVQAINRSAMAIQYSGAKSISAYMSRFAGSIAQTIATGGVSIIAARKTMQGNKQLRDSTDLNTNPGNVALKQNAATRQAGTGVPEGSHSPEAMPIARRAGTTDGDIEFSPEITARDEARARQNNLEAVPSQTHAAQTTSYAFAQDNFARGQVINSISNGVGGIAGSGAEFHASTEEAEAKKAENASRIGNMMAENESAQSKEKLQARDAVVRQLEEEWNGRASTMGHILSKV